MELKETSEVEAEKFKSNKTNITESWVKKHSSIYKQATRHPFILSIRDGTIHSSYFKQWLVTSLFFFLCPILRYPF